MSGIKLDYFSYIKCKIYTTILDHNITYNNNNIAFIVKWWDILIQHNVLEVTGTYITINDWIKWGEFLPATTWTTLNVLNIKGSVYWNIENLVNSRVKIEVIWNQINVWTIVSFGSSIFRKPAPLLSQFIDEYLKSEKIAK